MTDNDLFINISKELKSHLENLTLNNKPVFKKVLMGYDESKVKIQGDGVVAICYVRTSSDYKDTFGRHNIPTYINTVVGFIIRGSNEKKYLKAMKIKDKLRETLEHDANFYQLRDSNGKATVRNTFIMDSAVTLDNITGNKLDIIVVFNLRHHVYK